MIKFEHTEVLGWEHAIRGMRNPMNSWERSDSYFSFGVALCNDCPYSDKKHCGQNCLNIGTNDLDLMKRLRNGGSVHAKYRRMIAVYVDITAPLYWWKDHKLDEWRELCKWIESLPYSEIITGIDPVEVSEEHAYDIPDRPMKPEECEV